MLSHELMTSMRLTLDPYRFAILLALGIQLVVIAWAAPHFQELLSEFYKLNDYPDHYANIAENVATGNGYRVYSDTNPTMIREPGFVLLLAAIIALWGKSLVPIQLFNVACILLTALLTGRLAEKLGADKLARTIAVVGVILHPIMLASITRAGPECLFALLIVSFMLVFHAAISSERLGWFVLAGAVLGIAILTRGSVLPFTGVAAVYLVWRGLRAGRVYPAILQAGVLALAVVVTISPWVLRNAALTGSFVPVGSIAGDALFQGMYINKHSGTGKQYFVLMSEASVEQQRLNEQARIPYRRGFVQTYFDPRDELRHSRILVNQVLDEYRASPSLLFRSLAANFGRFWFQGRTSTSTAISVMIVSPTLLVALAGLFVAFRRKWDTAILTTIGLFSVTLIAVHMAVIAHARHLMPLVPFLMIFCGAALSQFGSKVRPKNTTPWTAAH